MNRLVLQLNQDKAGGQNARCMVLVDSVQVGDVLDVAAVQGMETEDFTLRGDWSVGQHTLDVVFLNDLFDPSTPDKPADRNLYLQHARINGHPIDFVPRPIKYSRNSDVHPIGFPIVENLFSVREGFDVVSAKLEDVRLERQAQHEELLRALTDVVRLQQALLRRFEEALAPSPPPPQPGG